MHEHVCEHELKYCDHCDVVWCKKCKREWGRGYPYYVYSYPWYPNTSPTWYTPTWTTLGTVSATQGTTDASVFTQHIHE